MIAPYPANTKIVITGSSGFVATHLIERLSDYQLFFINKTDNYKDILDIQPDIIFHTGAEIYNTDKMVDSNILLTYNLLECIKQLPIKAFIYIGSSSEYGRYQVPISESFKLEPTTMYEATKGCGSLLCQAYAHMYNKNICVVRPFSIYGINEKPHKLIPTLIRNHVHNNVTLLAEDPVHDWIYINDFIDAIISISTQINGFDIVNIGTGTQTKNIDIVNILTKILKTNIIYTAAQQIRQFDSTSWVCDPSHSIYKYNIRYNYDIEKGLADYIPALVERIKNENN